MIDNYKLWKEYKEDNSSEAREKLIKEYLPLVKYHAGRVKMIVPEFVEKDDLISFGVIGLIDALEKFDYNKKIEFSTYANKRVCGEIIDHLRDLDWLPHSLRRDGKKLKKTVEEMTQNLGRRPTVDEISEKIDFSRKKINKLYYKLYSSQWVSLDQELGDGESTILDTISSNENNNPLQKLKKDKAVQILSEAIEKLKEKQKLVISLYYYEDLTQVEIAEIMELSEARISQIHKKAVYRLRGFLSRKKEQLL